MGQIFESMEKIFQVANIVHSDFSEFNILYFQGRIWIIDVSQVNRVLNFSRYFQMLISSPVVFMDFPSLQYYLNPCKAVTRDHSYSLDFLYRDYQSIHRFLTKSWCLQDVPPVEAIFNRVTKFNFGVTEDGIDEIRFGDELEAAKMELQRRNNIKRGQFAEMIGDSDDFNDQEKVLICLNFSDYYRGSELCCKIGIVLQLYF